MNIYLDNMKKVFGAILILSFLLLPFKNVFASHLTCSVSSISIDSVTLSVASTSIYADQVWLIAENAYNNSYTIKGTPNYNNNNTATIQYTNLEPGTSYAVKVYNGAGIFVEDIKSCNFTTKGNVVPTPAPPAKDNTFETSANNPKTFETPAILKKGGSDTGTILDVHLQNPLKVDNIKDAIKFFVNTLIKIAIPFIVVFFIWAGLKFILAQGKPEKIKEAKQMFWYTIIGTLLILGAWTITNAIIGTVNSITN